MHSLPHSVSLTLEQATANQCLWQRLLDTHRQVWISLLWGHCFFLLGPGAHKVFTQVCKHCLNCCSTINWWLLPSIHQQIWKMQQWPQDWKRSVFTPILKKGNAKGCPNYCTIALISHTSEVMLKILQARLQQYMNCELPDVQPGFRNGRATRVQISSIC